MFGDPGCAPAAGAIPIIRGGNGGVCDLVPDVSDTLSDRSAISVAERTDSCTDPGANRRAVLGAVFGAIHRPIGGAVLRPVGGAIVGAIVGAVSHPDHVGAH